MPNKITKVRVQKPKVSKETKSLSTKTPNTKTQPEKSTGLTVKVYDLTGKAVGSVSLPKEIFGQKVNKNLLSQALHIYFTNSSTHTANTKTRGEVRGGGRKPWRQKGTGNARAGSKRSPLWVGGGQVFGPKFRNVKLTLPAKMRKLALISALSSKAQESQIKVISNLEKIQAKTKVMANLLENLEVQNPVLIIASPDNKNIKLASRNIQKTSVDTPNNLNAYQIIKNKNILISKNALEKFI